MKVLIAHNPIKKIKRALTYDQAIRQSREEDKIKEYIEKTYPEHGYSSHLHFGSGTFQGRQIPPFNYNKRYITKGKQIGPGQLKKIKALAKRKKDKKLTDLLDILSKVFFPETEEGEKYNL